MLFLVCKVIPCCDPQTFSACMWLWLMVQEGWGEGLWGEGQAWRVKCWGAEGLSWVQTYRGRVDRGLPRGTQVLTPLTRDNLRYPTVKER